MNPYEENLKNLIEDHITEPTGLSGVEDRFDKRFRKERRNSRIKISSAVTSLLVLFMFITANTDMAWAESLRKIPVLKELFTSMMFSSNYEDQIEELGLVSDNGEHQLSLQYALSDDKKISLYLQFPEYIKLEGYDRLVVTVLNVYDINTNEDYTSAFLPENSAYPDYFEHNYLSLFGLLPPGPEMHFPDEMGFILSASIEHREFSSTHGMKLISTEDLGEFSFETSLQKMSRTKNNEINKTLRLSGNRLHLNSIERSPLSTNLIITEDPDNTHRITGFEGKFVDAETGAVITDDLSSIMYDKDFRIHSIALGSQSMRSGAYAADLIITGVYLLDKQAEYITVDFEQKTMSPSIEGIKLSMVSSRKKSLLTFLIEKNDPYSSPFHFKYKTQEGEYKYLPHGSYSGGGSENTTVSYVFEEEIHGTITLRLHGQNNNHLIPLKEPIGTVIDVPEAFEPTP